MRQGEHRTHSSHIWPVCVAKSLIMEHGVDPNEEATNGWRPLHLAIDNGREQGALFLINEAPGVDIEAPAPRGNTPLMLAAAHGRVNVLRALVAKGANANAKNKQGYGALLAAISHKQPAAALYLINEAPGVDIDEPIAMGGTPLMLAAKHGMVGVLRALAAKGANLNAKSKAGSTALEMAIRQGQEEAALYLVEETAAAVYDLQLPVRGLCYAARYSECRVMHAVVRRMRADGVDNATVAREVEGEALFAIEKKVESLEALLEEGLDVSHAPLVVVGDWDGLRVGQHVKVMEEAICSTPLFHFACCRKDRDVAALLVERGCDPLAHHGRGRRVHHVVAARKEKTVSACSSG